MRTEFAKLIEQLRKEFPDTDLELVRRAYREAERRHHGQMRLSGDPHISHSLAVARILGDIGLDPVTIAAGLLHDVLEDTPTTRQEIEQSFGDEIAQLVDGVTKIGTLHRASTVPTREEKQAENLRKMLVATAEDVRVILIKLADRLHNMRTIEHLPDEKIKRISRETLDIYAPLAHRLGISQWKWELEDHAFHQLNPGEYKRMANRVAMKRQEREARLATTIRFLEERLAEAEVSARVIGRPKHLYSIYRKLIKIGKDFDEITDVQALRIITQTESGCYNALGVVHNLWTPIPGRFKDYIAMPKENMYQSIHTVVMRENGTPLEIQIRSEEMDRNAREGIAAHWRYKEGERKGDTKLDSRLKWLRQMYEWLKETSAPEELLDSVRRDFQVTEVYVFTPKGGVKELPMGATPLDFAYSIHSDIGHQCIGARVNGRMVPFRYNLQTGDMVEILTSKNQTPHKDWIDIVVTGRARTRIRQRLRELGELERVDRDKPKVKQTAPASAPRKKPVQPVDDATREKLLRIEGAPAVAAQFAKCCEPMPGQPIVGYATKHTGITIHRTDCKNFISTRRDPGRIIQASWDGEGHFQTIIRVVLRQRPNMLGDLTNAMRPMNLDISKADYRIGDQNPSYFEFQFEAPDRTSIERVTRTLRMVAGVTDVQVLSSRELSQTS